MAIGSPQAQTAEPQSRPVSRFWGKHMLVSAVPIALMLALHLVHLLSIPLLSGAMQMEGHAHHHGMGSDGGGGMEGEEGSGSSSGTGWLLPASLLINLFGIGYAVRLLWLTRGAGRSGGVSVYVCRGVAIASLAASIGMLATLD